MTGTCIVGVVLAAGAGIRLGLGPKALLEYHGLRLVVRSVRHLRQGGCDHVVVVAGDGADRVRAALAGEDCEVVAKPRWMSGMGSSFRIGVDRADELLTGAESGFVLFALVDQPDVGVAVVARLVEKVGEHVNGGHQAVRVVAAGYPDRGGRVVRGHPIVFPVAAAREAADLASGDVAGRSWLQNHPDSVDVVGMVGLASGRDVDTLSDLRAWEGLGRVC